MNFLALPTSNRCARNKTYLVRGRDLRLSIHSISEVRRDEIYREGYPFVHCRVLILSFEQRKCSSQMQDNAMLRFLEIQKSLWDMYLLTLSTSLSRLID